MRIVCGTDFSEAARASEVAATALAATAPGGEIRLVHVLDPFYRELPGPQRLELERLAARRLQEEAQRLGGRVQVQASVLEGEDAARRLLDVAREAGAELVVVSARSHDPQDPERLGRTAERLARESPLPVLAVREAAGFAAWARRERPLRVLLAVDWTASSRAAIAAAEALCRSGPCEVTVAHVHTPDFTGEGARRYGIEPRYWARESRPEVDALLRRDLERLVGPLAGDARVSYVPKVGLGATGDHLIELADAVEADLLVLGRHRRRGLGRPGSVSSAVLRHGHTSVLLCPASDELRSAVGEVPRLLRVLVATDFSPTAAHAIPYGYAVLPPGGEVLLLHVADGGPPRAEERTATLARLQALVPAEAAARGITTRTEIVSDGSVAEAICQAAERFGADAIALSSHGRSGLTRAVLGSVAESVLRMSRLPVFIARPPPQ